MSLDDIRVSFREAIVSDGFTASACGCFLPSKQGPLPSFYFRDWPQEWLALYERENFVAHDYMVAEARRRIAPFTWREAGQERQKSEGEKRIWQATLDHGWADGFSVPIHGPGGYFGLVAMAGREVVLSIETRQRLHLLAFAAHERCRALSGPRVPAEAPLGLTARELECLRWVAAGLSDTQIAPLTGISASTVKFHIEAGRNKLAAKTRSQAIARLAAQGLL